MASWKAAGPELVQGSWFKKLLGLHSRLQECLQDCICQVSVPEWMVYNNLFTHDVEALDRNHGR